MRPAEPDPSTETRKPDRERGGFVNDLANPNRPWALIPSSMGSSYYGGEPSDEDLYNEEWLFGPRRYRG